MQILKVKKNEKGYVISIVTFFVLIIILSITLSMSSLIFYRQKISTNSVSGTKSYYAAEAGIEDALMILRDAPQMSPISYNLDVGGTITSVTIPSIIGSSRAIVSQGNENNKTRSIQAVYSVDSTGISFHYGAQVGAGGLIMENGSIVQGNVFSNGNITGSGTINNNVIVSGNGNSIQDVYVGGDALVYSCLSSASVKNLTYVTGGTKTCTVRPGGTTGTQSNEITPQPLPISQAQIDNWKTEALSGGTSGDVTVSGTQLLGPKKIIGKLTLNNNATLIITGTLHVTDEIILNNGSILKLDTSYGSLSGTVISDGKITINNNSSALGSGQSGSNLLMLSTNTDDAAIKINNNSAGGIFYTSVGGIDLNNNTQVKELTGYKIKLNNNAVISYESGLQNVLFTDGPSGGWRVVSWVEQ
mgnify:FL=1